MSIFVVTYDSSTGGFRTQKIGSVQISDGAILSGHIASGQVASGHLTSAIISLLGTVADGAITSSKISSGAVGVPHIFPAAITSAKIAAGAIGGVHILDGSIVSGDIAANVLATPHILNQGILSASFGAAIIGAPHLAANAIVSGKVASGGLSPLSSGKIWAGFTGNMPREENKPDGLFKGITQATVYWVGAVSSSPRTATVSSVAGDVITLTSAVAYDFGTTGMDNVSYLKIANTTRGGYAWVKTRPANNQLQVTVAGDISAWQNGDTISTAYDGATSPSIEIDLSPSISSDVQFVAAKLGASDTGTIANNKGFCVSKDGTAGTWLWANVQVSGIYNRLSYIVELDANQHCLVKDIATGVNTLNSDLTITAGIT